MRDTVAHAHGLVGTRIVSAGFAGEQGGHTVVPAAKTTTIKLVPFIRNAETLTGWAHVGTGAAGQTLGGLFGPEFQIGKASFKTPRRAGNVRSGSKHGLGLGLDCLGCFEFVRSIGQTGFGKEGFSLVGNRLQHKASIHRCEDNIRSCRVGGATACPVAEAG